MATLENPYEKVHTKMLAARIQFMAELAKFSQHELTKQPSEGEWSPLELAHHIYIADGLVLEQMQLVQSEENPLLVDTGEEAPRLTRSSAPPVSLAAVLAGMAARREELFTYLASLPIEAWERPFRHPTWGQRKFYQMANILPMHDQAHTKQLATMKP